MAIPMAFGPYMFHATRFGYNGLGRTLSTRWADIPTVGGLNSIQWTGGDDDAVMVEGVIFPKEFGGLAVLESIRGAAASGMVLPLITLAGNVYGMHVIEMVSEDQSFHDEFGMPRKNIFRLGLRHHPGGAGLSPISIVQTLFG